MNGAARHRLRRALERPLALVDTALDRLVGWRANPLYHSGAIAVLAFLLMLATGLYLLLLYRIGAPNESVAHIQQQAISGRWMRALHRYAADAAVVAAAVHVLRMVEARELRAALERFRADLAVYERPVGETDVDLELECERTAAAAGS